MQRIRVLSLLLLIAAALQCAQSQSTGLVYGTVADSATGEPLAEVNITVENHTAGVSTDSHGAYRLRLPPGPQTLHVSHVGYLSKEFMLTVLAGDSVQRNITLTQTAIEAEGIEVWGERMPLLPVRELDAVAISPKNAESISGAFQDIYRTVQAMVGTATNNETSSEFSVRGGAVDENLVLLNGSQVLQPFHLKESPNTSVSTINMDLLGNVLFLPGGFPARYGDRLSSVIDLTLREGNRERFGGQLDASLVNGGVVLEGPFSESSSGLVSARTTYSDYVARYLPDGDRRNPQYIDLQGIVGFAIGGGNHVSGQLLHSYDKTSGLADGNYGTTLYAVGSRSAIDSTNTLEVLLSHYRQTENLMRPQGIFLTGQAGSVSTNSEIAISEGGLRFESRVSDGYSLLSGAGVQRFKYDTREVRTQQTATGDSITTALLNSKSNKTSAFVENVFHFGSHWSVNGGIRLDYVSLNAELKVSPRLMASYRFSSGTLLKSAWGLYYQSANHDQLLAAIAAGLPPPHMQRATHYTLGVEHPVSKTIYFRVEGYIKLMDGLISYRRFRNGEIVSSPRNDARGNVNGIEFEASFSDPRVFGWINVAVMRAEELNYYDGEGWHFRPTDQRKTVTTVFEIRLTKRLRANIRAFYGSGFAYGDDLPLTDPAGDPRKHYPEYTRADVRLGYLASFGSVNTDFYCEVLNIFARRNAYSFRGQTDHPDTPDVNVLLPTIVNVGMRLKY